MSFFKRIIHSNPKNPNSRDLDTSCEKRIVSSCYSPIQWMGKLPTDWEWWLDHASNTAFHPWFCISFMIRFHESNREQ